MEKSRDVVENEGSRQTKQGLRRSYDAAFKIMVINEAETSNNCQAAKKYGVTECHVRKWRAQKDNLRNANSQRKAFRGPKSGRFQELERRVCEYVAERCTEGVHLPRADIQTKALEVAEQLNISRSRFEASLGWCKRMMRRNGLSSVRKEKEPSSKSLHLEVAEKRPHDCFPVPVTGISSSDNQDEEKRGRKYCALCLDLKKKNFTFFECRSCNVALCILPDRLCFTEWHDLQKARGPEN